MKETSKKVFHIKLLGYPSFESFSSQGTTLPTQKAKALLLFLVGEQVFNKAQVVPKEKIVDLLWPGMPLPSALQNLRQTLYQIRKVFSGIMQEGASATSLIESDRKGLWLANDIAIQTDLDWYRKDDDVLFSTHYQVSTLIDLYRHPFLENFHLPNAPQYDEWIERCRTYLADRHVKLLESVLKRSVQGDASLILSHLLTIEPYSEQYHLAYLRLLSKRGERDKAVLVYENYQRRLNEDLGLAPSPTIKSLIQSLQKTEPQRGIKGQQEERTAKPSKGKWILLGGITTLSLLFLLLFRQHFSSAPIPGKGPRIAILPIQNNTTKEFLADGITDEILIGLTKLPGLKLISRQSTMPYKNSTKTPAMIGNELNVDYLLKGSLSQFYEAYKVNIALLESETGEVLWAESFTQDTTQIFSLQNLITDGISRRLIRQFAISKEFPTTQVPTTNSAAYQAYLRGRYLFYKANPEDLHQALAQFQQALKEDPTFNLAHAWMAWTYCSLAGSWGDESPQDMYPKVLEELSYIEQDESLKSMYFKVLGWMHFWLLDRNKAAKYLREAANIDPNEEFGLSAYAMMLTLNGAFEEGQQIAEKGLDLNPHFFWNHFVLGQAFYFDGKFEEARTSIDNGLALLGTHQASIGLKAKLLLIDGQKEAAIDYLIDRLDQFEQAPASVLSDLGLAYAAANNQAAAEQIATQLLMRHENKEKYTAYFAAKIFAVLGKQERTLNLLESAWQNRDNELNWLEVDLEFRSLHNNSRFQRILTNLRGSVIE